MELLSPAGNYEAFLGALNAGCDAVYLGGNRYGARAYADNLSDTEIISAIRRAHIFGVRVYLTVNTLIKESEWQDVIEYLRPFYEAGLDGCIVQDIGLISAFSEYFPGMECHVSTQAFVTGRFSTRFYRCFGVTRVVLARELSMEEISSVRKNENIEVEAFVHGAMCYCYSGNCLFSSCLGGRSGNRGRCAGPCRLEYTVISGNRRSSAGFYLSMKDQCALPLIPELAGNGIDSLKIEGRMKKPEYSAFVTSLYRKYIDLYERNPGNFSVDPGDIEDLKHMYLRSGYGEGYYHQSKGREMISVDSPAYNGNDDKLMKYTAERFLAGGRRAKTDIIFRERVGEKLLLTLVSGDVSVTVEGPEAEPALKRATTDEDIRKQLIKLGDTCFLAGDVLIDTDGSAFIPVSTLNGLRREAAEALTDAILQAYDERKVSLRQDTGIARKKDFPAKSIVTVLNFSQFERAVSFSEDLYLAVPVSFLTDDRRPDPAEKDLLLDLPYVMRDADADFIGLCVQRSVSAGFKGIIVHNTEELGFLIEREYEGLIITGPEIYAWNKRAVKALFTFADAVTAPLELTGAELMMLPDDLYVFSYGRIPLMNSANCIERTAFSCKKNEGSAFIKLVDRKGIAFPVRRDCDRCFNTIYNCVPLSLHREVNAGKINRSHMYISFTDEEGSLVTPVLKAFFYGTDMPEGEYTRGYRQRGVE